MNLVKKIVSGNDTRPSRLHDHQGHLVPHASLVHLPRAVGSYLGLHLLKRRPELPWLGYSAIAKFQQIITPKTKILEFGSGMSTLWFAKHCDFIHSIETYEPWYELVMKRAQQAGLTNLKYVLRTEANCFDVSDYTDGYFDFALVDGVVRAECIRTAFLKVRPGGYVYLDNSDMAGEMLQAVAFVKETAQAQKSTIEYFVDFAPTQLFVNQGMLIRL